MLSRAVAISALVVAASACASSDSTEDQMVGFQKMVESQKLGDDIDHWIEMENIAGEWEKVGLIFGYMGDHEECEKAIRGLKKVNYARNYRCVPAQVG